VIRTLRFLAALYVLIVLQTTLVPSIAILGVRPDLAFVLVLLVALREGAAGGALAGFVAGLFVDMNSAQALGTASLASALVAFGVGLMAGRLVRASIVTRLVVAFVGTVLRDELVALVLHPGGFVESSRAFVSSVLPGGLYTALLAPAVMALCEWIVGWERGNGRGVR
jgi:rod shape-determining protein MreD